MRRAAGVALALLALTGCGVLRQAPPTHAGASPTTGYVLEERNSNGVPGCAGTSGTGGAVPGGLPDLTLECLGGDSSVRVAGTRPRPVVVVAWAQWCEPCRAEFPAVATVLKAKQGKVDVLLVDTKETQYLFAVQLLGATGATFPSVVDPDATLLGRLGLPNGIPQTLLVGADGRITAKHLGPWASADELEQALAEKLGVS